MKLPGLIAFSFLIFLVFAHENNLLSRALTDHPTGHEYSPGFIEAAKILKEAINESVDPCEDFFDFACGKWIENNPIPDDHTSYSHFDIVREKVFKEMRDLYEDETPSTSNAINNLKKIYAACMDIENINKGKSHDLNKEIEMFGYWPMIHGDKWSSDNFDLTTLLLNIGQSLGAEVFISNYITQDQKNISRRLLKFDQGGLGLGGSAREYYLNETKYSTQLNAYEKYMKAMIELIAEDAGINTTEIDITSGVKEILRFEKQFAMILTPKEKRRNHTEMYNTFRFSDLQTLMPLIDWNKYFKGLIPTDMYDYLDQNPEIMVAEPAYFRRLKELLSETTSKTITNYIFWRYVPYWDLDDRFDDIRQEFLYVFVGRKTKAPRWKKCNGAARSIMSYAAGAMYVRSYFNQDDRESALEMIENLKDVFKEVLSENDWMEESTRKYALEKANETLSLIGFPDFLLNDTALDEHYDNLTIAEGETYSTIIHKTGLWSKNKSFRRLKEEVQRDDFIMNPSIVNAFYTRIKNAITFPAAILQSPFFDRSFPKMINYGGIGSVIGHEITHAFDDQGSQFDKIGNLHNWWDTTTRTTFFKKTQCMIDQYNQYKVPETNLTLNGILTQGENIADNGGLKQAYRAYRRYIEKLGHEEDRLPGFENYTNNQIFYMSYAQTWCGHSKPEVLISQVLTGVHPPHRFRVNVVVQNQPEFSTAFNCPVGSKMNPKKRCAVW